VRIFDHGASLVRYLVTTCCEAPRRRIDVVPVVLWDPDEDTPTDLEPGRRVWVAGSIQRRFWDGGDGRRSRVEVIAHHVQSADGPAFGESPHSG
jgi:single-stranded DNA-binding protein